MQLKFLEIIFAISFLILVLLSAPVQASHSTCWNNKGIAPNGDLPRDFAIYNGVAFTAMQSNATVGISRFDTYWTGLASYSGFSVDAIGIDQSNNVVVAGKQIVDCPTVGTCARIQRIDRGQPYSLSFTIDPINTTIRSNATKLREFVYATRFKRFIHTPENTFLIADRGVAFVQETQFLCGYQWCGKQFFENEEFTAFTPDGNGALVGTSTGKIYNFTHPLKLTFLGQIERWVQVSAITRAENNHLYAVMVDGKVFYSTNNGATWKEIGSNLLPPGGYRDLVSITVPRNNTEVALYTIENSTTYAFFNASTLASTYNASPRLNGSTRMEKDGSRIWAFSLSSGHLLSFNCSATPMTLLVNGTAGNLEVVIPYGGNLSLLASNITGNSTGHSSTAQWRLLKPVQFAAYNLFKNYIQYKGWVNGTNALRPGTYILTVEAAYNSFPQLSTSRNVTLVILTPDGRRLAMEPDVYPPTPKPSIANATNATGTNATNATADASVPTAETASPSAPSTLRSIHPPSSQQPSAQLDTAQMIGIALLIVLILGVFYLRRPQQPQYG